MVRAAAYLRNSRAVWLRISSKGISFSYDGNAGGKNMDQTRYSLHALERELDIAFARSSQVCPPSVKRALKFAFNAHAGQFRESRKSKADLIPYIVHPVGVAKQALALLPQVVLTDSVEEIVCACLTHDVLEDSAESTSALGAATSDRVVALVSALTKPKLSSLMSRKDRDSAFVRQINEAGPSAKFIKICDALHNLSRPGSMPSELLRKTVQRAAESYLPLCNERYFRDAVRIELEKRIEEARDAMGNVVGGSECSPSDTFEAAIGYCIASCRGKMLEEHDIVRVLEEVSGGNFGWIGTNEEFLRVYFGVGKEQPSREVFFQWSSELDDGCMILRGDVKAHEEFLRLGVERIVSCAILDRLDLANARRVFIAVGASTPGWFNGLSLTALVSILGERLRAREAREVSIMAGQIARCKLKLDAELAVSAKLRQMQLGELSTLLEAAEYVQRNVEAGVQALLGRSVFRRLIDRRESRVKEAGSIVMKAVQRGVEHFGELDDIVGLRLITLSRSVSEGILGELAANLREPVDGERFVVDVLRESISVAVVKSNAGYSSKHLRFRVASPTRAAGSIGCEVQVRTVFEDSWARGSQMVSYKRKLEKTGQSCLDELAALRDRSDEIADHLVELIARK